VKTIDDIRHALEGRLRRVWHMEAAHESTSWPIDVPLGSIASDTLASEFPKVLTQVSELRDWASARGLHVIDGNRRVHGTTQPLPTHVRIPNVQVAAAVCGSGWPERVARGERRASALRERHPACDRIASVVRSIDGYSDLDFELLVKVTDWFTTNRAEGLTPRQVPIPGVHAKWLNTHRQVIETLIDRSLGLVAAHPGRIHFTYLDPDHLLAGGRRFDSATVGDSMDPAYKPDVVVITENKDTAIHFPPTPRGVAIEGCGYGGATVAGFTWIVTAAYLLYWGDLDAAGFEILDGYRGAGVPVVSMLMDTATYRAYAPWGTLRHPNGQLIGATEPKPAPHLTDSERAAYHAVCNPIDGMPPRIEQERIPIDMAHGTVLRAISGRLP
jgi:hypothetical protein